MGLVWSVQTKAGSYLSRLRERSTRSKSVAGEGFLLWGMSRCGDTLSPTLPRRRRAIAYG
ncbi:hypothetical protein GGD64_006847 [Bradyrhizobium sp. CIR3A]|nr:hypothetical protein [Bradyrhizobium sp. CIR3A]